MSEADGDHPVHVEPRGYPEGTWMDGLSTNSKGEHGHPGYWTSGTATEGGGGDHRHLPEGKCPPPLRPAWVMYREGNGDGDTGTEAGPGVIYPGPRTHVTVLP